MTPNLLPFNIELLVLRQEDLKTMMPITAGDIMVGATKNFHPEGLYSTEIFGKVGTEVRNRKFAYIDLRVGVLHPVIYTALTSMRQMYAGIMAGTEFAIWDNENKDFVKSTILDGETGYSFFMKYYKEIKFEDRDSTKREFFIKLLEKYKDNHVIKHLVVIPAGIRDFEYDADGKPSEDEINTLYRKVLAMTNLIPPNTPAQYMSTVDTTRNKIQLQVNAIYDYISSLVDGKHKLILGKWATRAVVSGTRNVITGLNNDVDELGSDLAAGINDTVMGVYQYAKGALPLTIHSLRTGFLANIFIGPNTPAVLVNKKTLHKESVEIDPGLYDEWMSDEGLEKVITRFSEEGIRHTVLTVNNHYFGLIYRDGTYYKLLQDIAELPEDKDPANVKPITFAELLYLACHEICKKTPALISRYPITGLGSIYPSWIFLKSTVKSERLTLLDENWQATDKVALQMPIEGSEFFNSMSPHPIKEQRLGADHDGDMCSATIVHTESAFEEIKKLLGSRAYYIGPDGKFISSLETHVTKQVLNYITR